MSESIIESYKKADQEQLFKYYEALSKDEQSSFLSQLSKINDPSELVSDSSRCNKILFLQRDI